MRCTAAAIVSAPSPARRAAEPGGAVLDRMLSQFEDADRWMLAYRARRDYPAAEARARRKSEGGHGHAARSRQVPLGHYDANPGEIVRGTANAITGIW
jgi:hypothetical protein